MKANFIYALGLSMALASCQKSQMDTFQSEEATNDVPNQRICTSHEVLQQQLQADPTLANRMAEIERFTESAIKNPSNARRLTDGTIEIPVVFNVLYKTAAQNVSLAQLQSQINVLNADFAATNTDYNLTSTYNSVKSGNTGIRFVLSAVNRKSTTKTSWTTNDAVKKTASGGLNPTNPTTTLNIWVCNLSGGVLGYAQFPGGASATDGVVLDDNATGNTGTAAAPFNKGRTATHEVGHYLNLRHIWGDATCGNDQVSDTPLHNTANYGCQAAGHKSTCTGTPVEMTMNYMDYTDDACMYMFSAGQKARMQALFVTGGARNSLAQP
jgi:hypothetical protein